MRIEVTGKKMELTDAIREHADSKCQKLLKFYDGVQEIQVVIEEQPPKEFGVEIVVDAVKHNDFVANAKGENVYTCIDQAVEKMSRQLHDFKEKLRDNKR